MSVEIGGAALVIKFLGAAAGAALALVFVPPRSMKGFVRRLIAAMIAGPVFAPFVQTWGQFDPTDEGLLAAACLTSFASWWTMGTIKRVIDTWQGPSKPPEI